MNQKKSAPLYKPSSNLATNAIRQVRNRTRAFTLIELLVVIVIVGILATVSVAQFNDYQERARMARAISFASQAEKILLAQAAASESQAVAIYKFDNDSGTTIQDLSGQNHNLSINPTYHTLSTETPDGSSQSLNTNDQGILSTTSHNWNNQLTLMGWIYLNSEQGPAIPLSIYDNSTASNLYITADNRIEFAYRNQSESQVFSRANTFKSGRWHHVLGTFDGQNSRLYLDGTLITKRSAVAPLLAQQGAVNLRLGYTPGSVGFDGKLDNIQIYDQSLPNDL